MASRSSRRTGEDSELGTVIEEKLVKPSGDV